MLAYSEYDLKRDNIGIFLYKHARCHILMNSECQGISMGLDYRCIYLIHIWLIYFYIWRGLKSELTSSDFRRLMQWMPLKKIRNGSLALSCVNAATVFDENFVAVEPLAKIPMHNAFKERLQQTALTETDIALCSSQRLPSSSSEHNTLDKALLIVPVSGVYAKKCQNGGKKNNTATLLHSLPRQVIQKIPFLCYQTMV